MLIIGVDTGGTFTDLCVEVDGEVHVAKVSSTPDDPARGFVEAVERILRGAEVAPSDDRSHERFTGRRILGLARPSSVSSLTPTNCQSCCLIGTRRAISRTRGP